MEDCTKINEEGTLLRGIQLRQLDILIEVDRICRKHNIKYWIDFGTLLGAVRHQGFIPWDDDIDITIPKEDYQRFKEIIQDELPKDFFFQSLKTDPGYKLPTDRIRYKHSIYVTRFDDFTKEYHKGIFMDIFIAIDYPKGNPKTIKFIVKWLSKINWFLHVKQDITLKNQLAILTFPIAKFILTSIWKVLCLLPKNRIGYDTKHVPYGSFYPKEWVFPLHEVIFENHRFFAPNQPNPYLTSIYGDYMQLPPVEKRKTHIIHAAFE